MYSWIAVESPSDLDKLTDALASDYNPSEVVGQLRGQLSQDVKGILIEENYVDKDYRSTYYEFYAKKGLRYSPFCVRLHFFKQGVTLTPERGLRVTTGHLDERYVGYMVLRPTPIAPIGRTVLSIHAIRGFAGAIIDGIHPVHLLGYPVLQVKGFPYMQQHTDISVCAHAVCWSILRHYSQRYRNYAEFLVADITRMASPTKAGGLIPSRGLGIDQACRVFSEAGLFPDVYQKDEMGERFYRLLNAYIESGFPVFAAFERRPHAITVIGHGTSELDAFANVTDSVLFAWESINSLVVVDDNYMPYLTIDCLDRAAYKVTDIGTFIVPLPEKIYLPAEAVEVHVVHLLEMGFPELDFSHLNQPVVRYFITTSARLRTYAREQETALPKSLFQVLMDLALPQFVWVAQIASLEDWKHGRCNITCVLDATASAYDEEPFFLVHDRERAFVYDRGDSKEKGWFDFDTPLQSIGDFRLNLTYRA